MSKLWLAVINMRKSVVGLLIICLLLCGCGSPKPESQEKQQNKKALKALDSLESQNEKIIQMLKGPVAHEEGTNEGGGQEQKSAKEESSQEESSQKPDGQEEGAQKKEDQKKEGQGEDSQKTEGQKEGAQKQESQKESQKEGSQKPEGQEEGAEKQEGQEEGSEKQQGEEEKSGGEESSHQGGISQESQDILMQGEKIDDQQWQKINEGIVELHQIFNEYMPLAMKQGASQDLNSHATDALNQMTMEAEKKELLVTLLEANNLSGYISEFYALHQDTRAPIKRSIYYTRSIILASLANDWQTSQAAMNELKSIWEIQKPGIAESAKDTVEKIDRAVTDLETVIQEKNQNLIKIKGNILMKNLAELESTIKTD